jgi:hypothetical protein
MERISLFIASPGDVATERSHVADVAARLNRNMAAERDVDSGAVLRLRT